MPYVNDLRNRNLEQAHVSRYSIHLGSTKIHYDRRKVFWWDRFKTDIEEFVAKCPNHEQVKVEHRKTSGLLQKMQVPTKKWEDINMNLVVVFPLTRRKNYST